MCIWFFFCEVVAVYLFFFFFSSRRRHTRLQGDWSSDVCSSDLPLWMGIRVRAGRILADPALLLLQRLLQMRLGRPVRPPERICKCPAAFRLSLLQLLTLRYGKRLNDTASRFVVSWRSLPVAAGSPI